ncbi:MAG: acyltransferase [Ruminococcus callidus]|nr:acyltransferase [Ruminococcus callidus]
MELTHTPAVRQESSAKTEQPKERNYQLDFLKLVFSVLVVIYHMIDLCCQSFIPEGSWLNRTYGQWGVYAVHFFFIVSGMLMANSIAKKHLSDGCSKASIDFVVKKYLSLAWPIITSIVLCTTTTVVIKLLQGKIHGFSEVADTFLKSVPELLMVSRSGVGGMYNVPLWYISAMLLCMLPLSYLLFRKRNFTLYVFSPLAALFILGYMCQANDYNFFDNATQYGFFEGAIYRAMSGLCFGICAYTICEKIKRINPNKNMRCLFTVWEVLLYGLFFLELFKPSGEQAMMGASLLLPIAVGMTFSGKCFTQRLFRFKWMKYCAPLSLYLYLNHRVGIRICEFYFKDCGMLFNLKMAAICTIAFSLLNYVIVYFGKLLLTKKLKPAFTRPD